MTNSNNMYDDFVKKKAKYFIGITILLLIAIYFKQEVLKNKEFNIKNKIIFEIDTEGDFFKEFKVNHWHTSYYLPTGNIVSLLNSENIVEMKKTASKIAIQLKTQNLSAVSYDNRLYPFVKKYLEPKIDKSIVYHIWYGPHLNSIIFKAELSKMKEYHDDRVKTILSSYKSSFEI